MEEAVRERDQLAKNGKRNTNEWTLACEKVRLTISEERRRTWREYPDSIQNNENPEKMWQTIHMLKGQTKATSDKVMMDEERRLVTDKQKANAFCKQYARVSRLKLTIEERHMTSKAVAARKGVTTSPNNDGYEAELTIHELQEVLNQLQEKKACGEDDIPPEALKHISDANQRILLDILN